MQSFVSAKSRRRLQKNRKKDRAFTLVEVMIVLFILMVLSTIGVVAVQGTLTRARIREADIFVKSMKEPLNLYMMEYGAYPSTAEGLDVLLNPPGGGESFVEQTAAKVDPWGNPYQYQYPGNRGNAYDLWSIGPDGIPDSGDEIGNWN